MTVLCFPRSRGEMLQYPHVGAPRAAAAALTPCRSMSAGPVRAESRAVAYGLLVSNQVCHDLSLTPFPHPPFLSLCAMTSPSLPFPTPLFSLFGVTPCSTLGGCCSAPASPLAHLSNGIEKSLSQCTASGASPLYFIHPHPAAAAAGRGRHSAGTLHPLRGLVPAPAPPGAAPLRRAGGGLRGGVGGPRGALARLRLPAHRRLGPDTPPRRARPGRGLPACPAAAGPASPTRRCGRRRKLSRQSVGRWPAGPCSGGCRQPNDRARYRARQTERRWIRARRCRVWRRVLCGGVRDLSPFEGG
jgi:hypothetical protein